MKVIVCLAVLDVDGVGGVGQLLVCHRVDAQHPGLLVPQLTATNNQRRPVVLRISILLSD